LGVLQPGHEMPRTLMFDFLTRSRNAVSQYSSPHVFDFLTRARMRFPEPVTKCTTAPVQQYLAITPHPSNLRLAPPIYTLPLQPRLPQTSILPIKASLAPSEFLSSNLSLRRLLGNLDPTSISSPASSELISAVLQTMEPCHGGKWLVEISHKLLEWDEHSQLTLGMATLSILSAISRC